MVCARQHLSLNGGLHSRLDQMYIGSVLIIIVGDFGRQRDPAIAWPCRALNPSVERSDLKVSHLLWIGKSSCVASCFLISERETSLAEF